MYIYTFLQNMLEKADTVDESVSNKGQIHVKEIEITSVKMHMYCTSTCVQ